MAYIKTNWVNDVTDVDAINMNHIEDGIKDNETAIGNVDTKVDNNKSDMIEFLGLTSNTWSSTATYVINDRVIYNNNIYQNISGSYSSTPPDEDTTNWTLVSLFELTGKIGSENVEGLGSVRDSYSTSSTDTYSCNYVNGKTGVVLYNNSTGTTGDVTLNSNLSNYSYIEIYGYHNIFNDSVYTKVDLSLNKSINVSTITTNSDQHRLVTQTYTKGTNILTRVYAFRTTILNKTIAEESSVDGEINITKVVGYK